MDISDMVLQLPIFVMVRREPPVNPVSLLSKYRLHAILGMEDNPGTGNLDNPLSSRPLDLT